MSNRILYIIIAIAVGVGIVATVINRQNATLAPDITMCTMDAMMCPDGSYVGRTGPNCEFVCP